MYRLHHGLLYEDEQMALLVQRVSGNHYHHFFCPLAAGVGFSYNPYVWDKEIDPHSGVLRLTFGLGIRAVDRVQDDYTRIVALNAPGKRPEKTEADSKKYGQREVDVVDLGKNRFASYRVNLVQCRPFMVRLLGTSDLGILPDTIDSEKILLKSDGPILGQSLATKVDRLVYVSPSAHTRLGEQDRFGIARLSGQLTHLPASQKSPVIMLVGPGRWGTFTPAMGVPVSLKEINTVSIIVELALTHEELVPDVSIEKHFFNHLVEMDMLYYAVFPDWEGN